MYLPHVLLGGLLLGSGFAHAQGNTAIEEISVTADFRQSTLNSIASSVSVLDEELINRRNAQHLEDLLFNAPNVNFASGSSRARFYQIRGIGERSQYAEILNPSVGLMIDGVDFSGAGNAAMLYDVEQVEILMGPQGTRYGSNALAGLINMRSKAPTEELTYGLQAETANYNSRGLAGYVSGPLSDNLQYRLAAQGLRSDGFGRNLHLNRATNKRDETLLRGRLSWQAATDVNLDFSATLVDLDNGFDVFSLDNIRDTLSDEPGFDRQKSTFLSTGLSMDNFSPFRLEATLAWSDSDIDYGYDEDWVYDGFHPWGYSSTDHYFRERETFSAEARLLSNESSRLFAGTTDWLIGYYYLQQDIDLLRVYTYLPDGSFNSAYSINRFALFAETSTALDHNWSLDFGLRAEQFNAAYRDSNDLGFAPKDDLYGGKLALNYHTAGNDLIYLSASRGYKTGGFNIDGSLAADLREFGPERLWNYELGYKGSLLDGRLPVQAALFYMDRSDVQIGSSATIERDDGSSEFVQYTGNAASGTNYGLELNTRWLATEQFELYANLGLLHSRYRDFVNSAGDDLHGRRQAHAPGYQSTLGSSIALHADLHLDINVQLRDSFYFSDSHNIRSDSYALLNSSLEYRFEQWQFIIWGRNLTNRDYHVRGFFFGNDPRDGYTAKGYTQLGEPRRYGLTVKLDF